MSRLKIEHGASKVRWTLLKTNIEESLAKEIDLMCEWSNNDRKYVVNELLRFALEQAEEFQKHKSQLPPDSPSSKAGLQRPISTSKSVPNVTGSPDSTRTPTAGRL